MALAHIGDFTVGELNVALVAAMGLLNPLTVQLDLFLTGQFGLGPLLLDVQIQFNAAIAAVAQLGLSLSNPFLAAQALALAIANVQASLATLIGLQAQLSAALAFGLPNLQVSAQIGVMASLAGTLSAKIGGIQAYIAAGYSLKLGLIDFLSEFTGHLSAGPVHLLSFTGGNLTTTGSEIASVFAAGLGPSNPVFPSDEVSGIVLLTKDPAVFASLSAILKVS